METPGFFLSFIAGLLSFFSPCVLAMAPGYLAVLTGALPTDEKHDQRLMVKAAATFILGFSLVFVLLGAAFSALGQYLSGLRVAFLKVGGGLLILLGLWQWGIFRFFPLQQEYHSWLVVVHRRYRRNGQHRGSGHTRDGGEHRVWRHDLREL